MTKQTEAERLAVVLMRHDVGGQLVIRKQAAAELRRQASLINQLMDEVARLQKREWVGLTDDQYFEIGQRHCLSSVKCYQIHKEIYEAIEAKPKAKNERKDKNT
jgi:hypothetical protein